MARRKRKPLTKTKPKSDYAKENQESILSEVCPKARLKESTSRKTTKEAKKKKNPKRKRPVGKVVDRYCCKGIYKLYDRTELVYVGMSEDNFMRRIANHYDDAKKRFTHFEIIPFWKDSLRQLRARETKMIRKYKPKYNKQGNPKAKK